MVLARGKVIADGPAAAVLGQARGRYGTTLPADRAEEGVKTLTALGEEVEVTRGEGLIYLSFGEPEDLAKLSRVVAVLKGLGAGEIRRLAGEKETAFLRLLGGEG